MPAKKWQGEVEILTRLRELSADARRLRDELRDLRSKPGRTRLGKRSDRPRKDGPAKR
jgi:hypothetical protein